MNVREPEEDQRKPASSCRGFGLATAAFGLGVGAAALYYFLNKGSTQPETEGASTSQWNNRDNLPQDDRLSKLRERAFRERPWTLEECSICFDVMLRDQEIMRLQCAHNFHMHCIMPWLQEKQTCPNCRKLAE